MGSSLLPLRGSQSDGRRRNMSASIGGLCQMWGIGCLLASEGAYGIHCAWGTLLRLLSLKLFRLRGRNPLPSSPLPTLPLSLYRNCEFSRIVSPSVVGASRQRGQRGIAGGQGKKVKLYGCLCLGLPPWEAWGLVELMSQIKSLIFGPALNNTYVVLVSKLEFIITKE